MDSGYQQAMIQALLGGIAQPGVMPNNQNPTTPYGQSAITGNPTVPGGMLGQNPNMPVNPNSPMSQYQTGPAGYTPQQLQSANQQWGQFTLQQPYQQYAGTGGPQMATPGGGSGGNTG